MARITEQDFLKSLYNQQKPKSYAQVSGLFEMNFQKISKLIPLLSILSHHSVAKQEGENDLHLFVEEKSPYTGIYTLTHQLNSAAGLVNRPDIRFKVYFDAQLLEVISVCNETTLNTNHPFLAQCSDMDIQWELNTFIERWLDYCLVKYNTLEWQIAK
ncbi:DUF1249 domain-containing protein [Candidatus Thioglobus sp.]|jgi:Uncharacterized protein conserved in bacteria|uniref:DUF1249 domain-containing protein n=1 Tax=Candidatus Thioglobus sp. TaxID=2026721 RepID=UPI00175900F5|nr:DUF1249 domain-containing protein [Candidatus Thioglobus sp.]